MSNKPQTRGIRPALKEYFLKHVGETVFIGDLASELQLSETQVANAVDNLRRQEWTEELVVEAVRRAWRYSPKKNDRVPGKRVFEEIGVSKTGDVVIQDEDGKLYRAVEL